MRITNEVLNNKLENAQRLLDANNINTNLEINAANGGYKIVKQYGNTGIDDLQYSRGTKKEAADFLDAMIATLYLLDN